ncbi:metallopeptidase TldD-related protein [Mycobacterium sp.]|uniref:metallopeptidase TldD-related protein n=1 Tax=Mycobacterium sp. TaxID=1785 RepID=UPI002CBC8D08|nr:metallopeptidase TldD-related protein [Mycobacterium sp.]HTY35359.1 metallopeptidase TldD-related protein [Mycobacterium sp.]
MTTAQALAERVLDESTSEEALIAIVDETSAVHVRWADDALTTNGSARSRKLTVVLVVGGAVGAISCCGALNFGEVGDLVGAARRNARENGAREPALLVGDVAANDWGRPPASTDLAALTGVATYVRACSDRVRVHELSTYGYAEQQIRTTYMASSTGLRLRHEQPTAIVDLTAIRGDGRSAWAGCGAAHIGGIDLNAMTANVDRTVSGANRRANLSPGRYEVLFAPSCVADLMVHLYRATGAREAMDGHGVFSRPGGKSSLGERLSNAPLTLRSDPAERGLECAPFAIVRASTDRCCVLDNGLPLLPTRWLTDGVLTALTQTRYTAEVMGQPRTAEIDNLVLHGPPGCASLPEMIARTDRALLVTSVWYLREVNRQRLMLTGTTRDGVYLIERGAVVALLPDFRFNESPVDLLARVTEIGCTERTLPREWGDYFTRVAMPALRVEAVGVSVAVQ